MLLDVHGVGVGAGVEGNGAEGAHAAGRDEDEEAAGGDAHEGEESNPWLVAGLLRVCCGCSFLAHSYADTRSAAHTPKHSRTRIGAPACARARCLRKGLQDDDMFAFVRACVRVCVCMRTCVRACMRLSLCIPYNITAPKTIAASKGQKKMVGDDGKQVGGGGEGEGVASSSCSGVAQKRRVCHVCVSRGSRVCITCVTCARHVCVTCVIMWAGRSCGGVAKKGRRKLDGSQRAARCRQAARHRAKWRQGGWGRCGGNKARATGGR